MRAVVVTKQGSPVHPNVQLVNDWPEPEPPPSGHVIVRTLATALNQLDLWVGRGVPGLELNYPRISGSDVCGVVESVGPGVEQSWVGRRIIMNGAVPQPVSNRPLNPPTQHEIIMIGEHVHGSHRERLSIPVNQVQPVGDVDPVEAAAFGLTFLTAWRCLVSRARLAPGHLVLITGIGGGVATSALAIAAHMGCTTIVTSRHQWKLDKARTLGAAHGILDDGSDWSGQVRAVTAKRGVDVALESVGQAAHLPCLKSLCRGGVLVTPGCTTGSAATTDLARIFWNQLSILGSTMGDAEEFAQVTALLRAGRLKPVIDKVFTPENASSAYERLESSEQFGKIVIDWR